MDLLTTYTHHSELQAITALLLISTIHKLPQHPLSLFPACYIFTSRSLATASNSGNSSALHAQVLLSQLSVQNSLSAVNSTIAPSLLRCNCTAQLNWLPQPSAFLYDSSALTALRTSHFSHCCGSHCPEMSCMTLFIKNRLP
jgi:hypothetical protein